MYSFLGRVCALYLVKVKSVLTRGPLNLITWTVEPYYASFYRGPHFAVVLNYVAVISWFPACIAFWETRLLNRGGGGGRFTPKCCRSVPKPLATVNAFFKKKFPRFTQMATFKSYAECLHRSRYQLLAICFTLVVGSTFLALRLPPSSDVPKLFPDDHNVQRFIDWTQSRFADESLSCASYTECAEKSLQELEELERLSPPAAGRGDQNLIRLLGVEPLQQFPSIFGAKGRNPTEEDRKSK